MDGDGSDALFFWNQYCTRVAEEFPKKLIFLSFSSAFLFIGRHSRTSADSKNSRYTSWISLDTTLYTFSCYQLQTVLIRRNNVHI